MRQLKIFVLMLLGVAALIGFTSCEEGIIKYHDADEISEIPKEVGSIIDADVHFPLYVFIEDESGNDMVNRWYTLYQSENEDEIYQERIDYTLPENGSQSFIVIVNLAPLHKNDCITKTIKVFRNDVENLEFTGKCIDYDCMGGGAIAWKFKDVEIPVLSKEEVHKEGKRIVSYSEITLVRHDDGTYSLKQN